MMVRAKHPHEPPRATRPQVDANDSRLPCVMQSFAAIQKLSGDHGGRKRGHVIRRRTAPDDFPPALIEAVNAASVVLRTNREHVTPRNRRRAIKRLAATIVRPLHGTGRRSRTVRGNAESAQSATIQRPFLVREQIARCSRGAGIVAEIQKRCATGRHHDQKQDEFVSPNRQCRPFRRRRVTQRNHNQADQQKQNRPDPNREPISRMDGHHGQSQRIADERRGNDHRHGIERKASVVDGQIH